MHLLPVVPAGLDVFVSGRDTDDDTEVVLDLLVCLLCLRAALTDIGTDLPELRA